MQVLLRADRDLYTSVGIFYRVQLQGMITWLAHTMEKPTSYGCTGGSIRLIDSTSAHHATCLHVCLQILKLLPNVPDPLPIIAEIHVAAEIPCIIYLRAELHCPSDSILSATRLIFCHPPNHVMGQPCVRQNLNQINCFQKNHRGHKSKYLCVNAMMTHSSTIRTLNKIFPERT